MAVHVLPMEGMSLLDEHERRHGSLRKQLNRAAASTADGRVAGNWRWSAVETIFAWFRREE